MYFYLADMMHSERLRDIDKFFMQAKSSYKLKCHPRDIIRARIYLKENGEVKDMYVFYPSLFTDTFVRNILEIHDCPLSRVSNAYFDLDALIKKREVVYPLSLQSRHIIYYFRDKTTGLYSFCLKAQYFRLTEEKPSHIDSDYFEQIPFSGASHLIPLSNVVVQPIDFKGELL